MIPNPFTYVNRRGIADVVSTAVRVTADNVVFSFPNHAFLTAWYKGMVLVHLNQAIPTGTTGTLPVLFETNGVTQPLTTYNGDAVTAANITGTGVYICYFDRQTNTLQLINN